MADTKRITFKPTHPNPLFQKWLQQLYVDATDTKTQSTVKIAIHSLSKYPLPLQSGSECAILKGFSEKLCQFIDQKLKNIKPSIEDIDSLEEVSIHSSTENKNIVKETHLLKKSCKGHKTYKPSYRSGGYAILMALLNNTRNNPESLSLTKEELIDKAQPLCEESLTRPKPDSFYTAWSTMARLISKDLVIKKTRKKTEYSLSEEGIKLATNLLQESKNIPSANDLINDQIQSLYNLNAVEISNGNTNDINDVSAAIGLENGTSRNNIDTISTNSNDTKSTIVMPAGSFDVVLFIDKQETSGASKKNDPTVAQFKKYPDLNHEYRHLKVGDFTWVARHKIIKDHEIVLPYIVERKRMDDLGASIKDGRFHEQKFRLNKCGLPNVLYLIENYGTNKHVGLPKETLKQAIANTRVQDGFRVHVTDSLTDSARFLAIMTKRLTIEYKDKTLIGKNGEPTDNELMLFTYFNDFSSKTKSLTVTETFIKLLLQLKGVSVEKALAIADVYKTPRSLINAYRKCNQKEGESLLANIKHGNLKKNVGPAISKTIYKFFTIYNLQ